MFIVVADQALGVVHVERFLIQPYSYAAGFALADDLIGADVVPGQLTEFVEYVGGDQMADILEVDDHGFGIITSRGQRSPTMLMLWTKNKVG